MARIKRRPGIIHIPAGVSDEYNTTFNVDKDNENGELGINLIKSPVYGFRQIEGEDMADNDVRYYGIYFDPDLTNGKYHPGGFSKGQVFNPKKATTNFTLYGIIQNLRVKESIIKPIGLSDYYNTVLKNNDLDPLIPENEVINQANWASQTAALSYNWHFDINSNPTVNSVEVELFGSTKFEKIPPRKRNQPLES